MVLLMVVPLWGAASAQDIASVKSNLWVGGTNTYAPWDTLNYFTVTGRVTSPFLSFTNTTEIFIQDATAGICVQSVPGVFALETNSAVFALGVQVTVFGKISQSFGMRYIRPELYDGNPYNAGNDFHVSGSDTSPVPPLVTTISNYLEHGEDYEGQLIRINGLTIGTNAWPFGTNTAVTATGVTGTIRLYIDKDTEVAGQLPPTNTFDLIGMAQQYTTLPTPSNGYEVVPCLYSNVIQTVGQEAPLIVVPTNVTAIVSAPSVQYAVGQDRNASDVLTLAMIQAPTAAVFTMVGSRAGRFDWTPDAGVIGTSTDVVFQVSDGLITNTATMKVYVRGASGGPGYAWINELHYDNDSTDTYEGVELAGQGGIDLSYYYIMLYNGGNGLIYGSNACTGVVDDEGNGYGAVWFPIAEIQNGAPDGIALCHVTQGLLQFLGYEGTFTASEGPAAGVASVNVGVSEGGSDPAGLSLQLQGNGTNYEAFTWTGPMAASPGDLNGLGQIIIGPVDAKVTYSGLALQPASPSTNDAFDIVCVIAPNYSALNLVPTAWYQINGGGWSSIAMSDTGGYTNKITSQIPAQTNGAIIDYYVNTAFDGPGTNSPMGSATNTHTILTFPPTIASLSNQLVQVSNELAFAVGATEPDGDLIELSASNVPANAAFYATNGVGSSAGGFTFVPDESQGWGVYTASFWAVDKEGAVWTDIVIRVIPRGYLVDFEGPGETKTAYASGNVTLSGMSWNMYSNLIGTAAADVKNGLRSARFRYDGSMTMLEDKSNGCGTVSLKHARYGTDSISTGRVEYSADQGTNWIQAGSDFVVASISNFTDFSATVNQSGNVRVRILKLAPSSQGARFNVDDILVTDYAGGADADGDGMPDWWETLYFTNTAQSGTSDYDNDFLSNLEEYLGDTIPTASNSFFALDGILQRTNRFVSFFSSTARVYTFQFNVDPRGGDSWSNLQTDVPGIGALMSLSDTNIATSRVYRVRVRPP